MSDIGEDEARGATLAHIARLEARIGVLELALRTAARRFSFMASVGWVNGVDPAVAHNECIAALAAGGGQMSDYPDHSASRLR